MYSTYIPRLRSGVCTEYTVYLGIDTTFLSWELSSQVLASSYNNIKYIGFIYHQTNLQISLPDKKIRYHRYHRHRRLLMQDFLPANLSIYLSVCLSLDIRFIYRF